MRFERRLGPRENKVRKKQRRKRKGNFVMATRTASGGRDLKDQVTQEGKLLKVPINRTILQTSGTWARGKNAGKERVLS